MDVIVRQGVQAATDGVDLEKPPQAVQVPELVDLDLGDDDALPWP